MGGTGTRGTCAAPATGTTLVDHNRVIRACASAKEMPIVSGVKSPNGRSGLASETSLIRYASHPPRPQAPAVNYRYLRHAPPTYADRTRQASANWVFRDRRKKLLVVGTDQNQVLRA